MLGYEDAATWVKAADWDAWDDLREWLDLCKERNYPEWNTIFPPYIEGIKVFEDRLGELHDRMKETVKEHRSFYRWNLKNQIDYEVARQTYMTAWLAYTDAVWALVRPRQDEHLERQLAQRAAPPTPETPERLFGDAPAREQQRFRVLAHTARLSDGVDPLRLNRLIADPDIDMPPMDGENGG
jgi:hypothetical protein